MIEGPSSPQPNQLTPDLMILSIHGKSLVSKASLILADYHRTRPISNELGTLASEKTLALSRFPPGLLSKNRPPVGYQRLVRYRPPPDTLGDHQGVADGQAAALRVLRPLVPS